MAQKVERLFREPDFIVTGTFFMGDHEDGVIAFGRTTDEAGSVLMRALVLSDACGLNW
jgi:hypothetical protein